MMLFYKVMYRSGSSFRVLFGVLSLTTTMFATLMYFFERGQWMPPNHSLLLNMKTPIIGREAYVRRVGVDGYEESPFRSVFHSMWYVLMTFTTVGYGDVVPTSVVSMTLFIFLITTGVTLLALPIGVIGQNFNEEFDRMNMEKLQRDKSMMKRRRKEKYTKLGLRPVQSENT